MTYEEAYEQIKEKFPNAIGNDCDVKAIVFKAIEKQIPKKYKLPGVTDNNGVFHTWNGINGRPYELCPNCEINLCTDGMMISKKPKYCSNCGQRLNWRVEE